MMLWHVLLVTSVTAEQSSCAAKGSGSRVNQKGLDLKKLNSHAQAFLDKLVADKEVGGVVAQISRDGDSWVGVAGKRDIKGEKMSADSLFRICSMTIAVTSVTALTLIEEGTLSLEDELSKYIPEFATANMKIMQQCEEVGVDGCEEGKYRLVPTTKPITIEQLFTHTSGLSYGFLGRYGTAFGPLSLKYQELTYKHHVSNGCIGSWTHGQEEDKGLSMKVNTQRIAQLPLLHEPGAAFSYGLSTDVLGRVIEVVTNKSLAEVMHERLLGPLGMDDTVFHLFAEKNPKDKESVTKRLTGLLWRDAPDTPLRSAAFKKSGEVEFPYALSQRSHYSGDRKLQSGGCGLLSTAADYSKFAQMLAHKGRGILSRKTFEWAVVDRLPASTVAFPGHFLGTNGWGLGFAVTRPDVRVPLIGSNGGVLHWGGWHGTYFAVDPAERLSVVFMVQCHGWSFGCIGANQQPAATLFSLANAAVL